jgi:general secretion pathway protein D
MGSPKRLGVSLITLCLGLAPVHAQFDKFKKKTKFKASGSAKGLVNKDNPTLDLSKNSGTDSFGRGTGINSVTGVPKDKGYVNLNPETAFGPEVVTSFEFEKTTLEDLTKHMQKLTGINLIMDGKGLKGKISITAPKAITVGDAWKAYLTALEINGFTLVKSGSFFKIVATRDIRYTPTKIYTGNYTPNTDNYVMRILPLKNIDSTEVTRSFRPFMSRYGRIIDIKQTNTIIVQDTGSNINRLVSLIKFIDVPGYEESLQMIPVKNSSAQEIAKLLDQILKGKSSGKFKSTSRKQKENISKIIAEPRTNVIIAMANADGARQLRDLIRKLDVKNVSRGGGRIHVYYINHGDAESLAKTLSSLVSGAQQSSSRRTSRLSRRSRTQASEGSKLFSDDVKITADKDNNALVVTASPTDYLTLKEVVKKLDVPRDQVYVEGLIMETNVSNGRSLGTSLVAATGAGNSQRIATGEQGDLTQLLTSVTGTATSLGGLFAGLGVGKRITIPGPNGQDIQVNTVNGLIKAIASNSNTNVLATPQVLALDNTESVFEVGEQVPIPKQTQTATGTTTGVELQKVALTLKIKPQINKVTRFIKLKIDQTIADFSNTAPPEGVPGVGTTERAINTTVIVRDKDTVAMGGLMRDTSTVTNTKVPLLGDIPVLGWLFRNSEKSIRKLNLLFFLTPRILANYQRDNAANVKDLLNRRSSHLKKAVGEDDPFGTTVKGLYEKVKKQEEGPLYEDNRNYQDVNEDEKGIGSDLEDDLAMIPNYKQIAQELKTKNSAVKRD